MNGLRIVATAPFLLLTHFNKADAAGLYDGEWTGTATSTGDRCKPAVIKLTVGGQVVVRSPAARGRTIAWKPPRPLRTSLTSAAARRACQRLSRYRFFNNWTFSRVVTGILDALAETPVPAAKFALLLGRKSALGRDPSVRSDAPRIVYARLGLSSECR
jgi:hypothetical protein